jgi:hypothetical protein
LVGDCTHPIHERLLSVNRKILLGEVFSSRLNMTRCLSRVHAPVRG